MKLERFTKTMWNGFAGSEPPRDGDQPYLFTCKASFKDDTLLDLLDQALGIVDENGINVLLFDSDFEGETEREYELELEWPLGFYLACGLPDDIVLTAQFLQSLGFRQIA